MNRRLQAFVVAICAAAIAGVLFTDWEMFFSLSQSSLVGFAALLGMGLLSESLAIRLTVGKSAGSSSITFIPLLASVQLFGPAAGVLLAGITGAFGEIAIRKKGPVRSTFNVAQMVFSSCVAGWTFTAFHGAALKGPTSVSVSIAGQFLPFILFGLVMLAINHAAVSMAITLSQGLTFRKVWDQMLGHSGANFNDILISPIALAVAFLYVQFGIGGILVVILPMLFIRHSYVTTARLREANRDLLKALVKAIETRDPYTSGHSVRVAFLARRIAEELGVARPIVESVETAALLHDIGKIDSVYSELLMKPSSLTPEERLIIESHVTKGEELVRNLSSFSDAVALSVRHHHEREDGCGYPDGLRAEQIPLGARLINVSDAIDAMLSDRPYRKALSLPTVMSELRVNSGTQFNATIVSMVIESGILAEFEVLVSRRATPSPSPLDVPQDLVGTYEKLRPSKPLYAARRRAQWSGRS